MYFRKIYPRLMILSAKIKKNDIILTVIVTVKIISFSLNFLFLTFFNIILKFILK